jgi:hypothetical protein
MHLQPVNREQTVHCSPPHSDQYPELGILSHVLRSVFEESGILRPGVDLSWLTPRVAAGLSYAHDVHAGKRRKRGAQMRAIHEVRCLQALFNLCQYPEIAEALAKDGASIECVMFGMATHDGPENALLPYETVVAHLAQIWNEPQTFSLLERDGYPYLTDENSRDHKSYVPTAIRIALQDAKGVVSGLCSLKSYQQLWRMIDKFDHCFGDAEFCAQEVKRLLTTGSVGDWAKLQSIAAQCLTESILKSFTLKFPLGHFLSDAYRHNQAILAAVARGDRVLTTEPVFIQPPTLRPFRNANPAGVASTFEVSMLSRWLQAAEAPQAS